MLDLLFPQRCVVCRRSGEQLCASCRGALARIPPPVCERCGTPTAWPVRRCAECAGRRLAFARARSALLYDDSTRTLVAGWKERGLRGLSEIAAGLVVEIVPRPDADVLTFVPPDGDRSLSRGHHPAERLARGLGLRWELPVGALLGRTGDRPRQAGLSPVERRRNTRGAFIAAAKPPARVCLVDDVYTTGATAAAAASALRRGGARRVEVVTLARAVR